MADVSHHLLFIYIQAELIPIHPQVIKCYEGKSEWPFLDSVDCAASAYRTVLSTLQNIKSNNWNQQTTLE